MSRHRLIKASAGTGKTHQLALRFVELLLEGARPAEVLASTFTVRAAGEIRDRVMHWLADAADEADRRASLSQQLGVPLEERRARQLLHDCARQMHRLQISTLDAFFSRIARAFSLELQLPGAWRIGEEHELAELRTQAIARLFDRAPDSIVEWVRLLSKGDSPRGVWSQLDNAAKELHAHYLESDESAWSDQGGYDGAPDWLPLADRLEALAPAQNGKIAKRMSKDAELLRARPVEPRAVLDSGIGAKLLAGETTYSQAEISAEVAALYEEIGAVALQLWRGQQARRTETVFRLLTAFDGELQKLKAERSILSFDDLPRVLAVQALLARMDEIWSRLDSRVSHLLLDEFQDTSRLQWAVLAPLAREALAREDKSLFAVGDLKQAIYRWRGAEPRIFLALAEEASRAGATSRRLDVSYRSAREILQAVDQLFGDLTRMESLDDAREAARAWSAEYVAPDTVVREPGDVWLHGAELGSRADRTAMARATIDLVETLLERNESDEIAILVRTLEMMTHVRHECIQRGIALSEEGGTRLDQYAAPQLLMSLVRLAEHPGDRIAAFHLLHSPLAGPLGLEDDDRSRTRVSRSLRAQFRLDGIGGTLWRHTRAISASTSQRSLRMIEKLVQAGFAFDRTQEARPSDFLRYVETRKVEDPQDARVRVLTIFGAKGLQFRTVILCDLDRKMIPREAPATVHRDDPLRAPSRIRMYAHKDLRALDAEAREDHRRAQDERIKEELSLLYVGMTRAERSLHIVTGAGKAARGSSSAIVHEAFGAPEAGDSRLLFGVAPSAEKATARPPAKVDRAPLRLAAAGGRRAASSQSPSGASGASVIAAAERIRPRPVAALVRGRALHAALACVQWSDDGMPDEERWFAGMRRLEPELDGSALREGLAEFRALWPRLAPALSRSAYANECELLLWRERAFATRDAGRLWRGRFDRVVLGREDGRFVFAHVLDFKSDAREDVTAAQLADQYRSQMESYARAIQVRCELPRTSIRLSLLWSTKGELVEIDA